jgi:hypothetical protein
MMSFIGEQLTSIQKKDKKTIIITIIVMGIAAYNRSMPSTTPKHYI